MDNLTHSLTGLMLARAGLNRLSPRAGLILVLAANVPDVDVVSWIAGRARYLDIHRGYTHAWLSLPLMALLPVVVAWWSLRWPRWAQRLVGGPFSSGEWSWGKAWLASGVGVASHVLLDWTNSYGVRLGMPLEAGWHRLDILFIVDPWVWGLLLIGVAGPFLSRLVSLEIGAKRTSGAGAAWFVLVTICGYLGGRYLFHEQALTVLSTRVYDGGQEPKRVAAFPAFGNPLRWRAVVELGTGYWVSDVNLLQEFDPAEGRVFYQAGEGEAIAKARSTEDFQAFLRFNQFPLWRVTRDAEETVRVDLFDLRFGDPAAPGFVATLRIKGGQSEDESLRFGSPKI